LIEDGQMIPLAEPYPGSNLFSLASGGAAFIRDPYRKLVPQQLNGCIFTPFTEKDWELILPYLRENERFFGIKIDELLTVDGKSYNHPEFIEKFHQVSKVFLQLLKKMCIAKEKMWKI